MLWGRVRAVSVILVAVLAGHPVVTTLCDLVCSGLPAETHFTYQTAGDREPIRHEPVLVADRDGGRLGSGHHQHRSAALETHGESTRHAQVLSQMQDCCNDPGVLQVSAAASRVDASLIPTLQPGVLNSVVLLDRLNRYEQSSPPEVILAVSSPARTPLVLRV